MIKTTTMITVTIMIIITMISSNKFLITEVNQETHSELSAYEFGFPPQIKSHLLYSMKSW